MAGRIVAVCLSDRKGIQKTAAPRGLLVEDRGLEGDAHAGPGERQVSLLAEEDIDGMRLRAGLDLPPGAFGENLVTRGIDLLAVPVGGVLRVGPDAVLVVTRHGKVCHDHCAIYEAAGDCIMPRRGVFARVLEGGEVRPGDRLERVGGEGGESASSRLGDR
ncbi:MAG: MOSC domain-containing protein [Acidobacteriota bacterium]